MSNGNTKPDLMDSLSGVIDVLTDKIAATTPGSAKRSKLQGLLRRLTNARDKLAISLFPAATPAFEAATANLKKVTKAAKEDIKSLQKIAAILKAVSLVMLAVEQVIVAGK